MESQTGWEQPQEARIREGFHRLRRLTAGLMTPDPTIPRGAFMMMMDIDRYAERSGGSTPGIKVTALAARGNISPPAVSRTLRFLEERGLAERIAALDDRRVVYVSLTPQGKQAMRQMYRHFSESVEKIMAHLGAEDTEQFLTLLSRVCDAIEEVRREQHPDMEASRHGPFPL